MATESSPSRGGRDKPKTHSSIISSFALLISWVFPCSFQSSHRRQSWSIYSWRRRFSRASGPDRSSKPLLGPRILNVEGTLPRQCGGSWKCQDPHYHDSGHRTRPSRGRRKFWNAAWTIWTRKLKASELLCDWLIFMKAKLTSIKFNHLHSAKADGLI